MSSMPFNFDIAIDGFSLTGFQADQTGGSPAIAHYLGLPLYCHVNAVGPGLYSILINTSGPSTFAVGTGLIQLVTLIYDPTGAGAPAMTFAPNSAMYNGQPIDLSIEITSANTGTLQLAQRPVPVAAQVHRRQGQSGNIPTITLVRVAASENGSAHDIVFFTDIALPQAKVKDGAVWTASITWSDNPGGAMGPLGYGETP